MTIWVAKTAAKMTSVWVQRGFRCAHSEVIFAEPKRSEGTILGRNFNLYVTSIGFWTAKKTPFGVFISRIRAGRRILISGNLPCGKRVGNLSHLNWSVLLVYEQNLVFNLKLQSLQEHPGTSSLGTS